MMHVIHIAVEGIGWTVLGLGALAFLAWGLAHLLPDFR